MVTSDNNFGEINDNQRVHAVRNGSALRVRHIAVTAELENSHFMGSRGSCHPMTLTP